ncbi:uncharacterized protein LOC130054550 [Ostrea edulis]|uniref:uncharacterized protein LOC130054550 n=1 Tax=Ostrea edulis TaxID=37623 RepID=UPI0024AFED95|nr:uncharacterized protein LOC130054550 [Ostrea edulis]
MNEVASQGCSQNTSLNCPLHDEQQNHDSIPVILLTFLIGILTLLFNSGVLVLIVKEKKIRLNPYHFVVLMLCVSDFLVGLGATLSILRRTIPVFQMSKVFAIFNTLLMITGLYLSLYHTFLISLQRFFVICKEKWNSYIFCENRKYFVCIGGSIVIFIINCVLISPPMGEFGPPVNVNILSFVYNGHYAVYSIYIRFFTLFLLSSTVILYLVTMAYVHRTYRKISPIVDSNALRVIKINVQTIESHPSVKACTPPSVQDQVNVGPGRSRVEHSNQMDTLRRKKVVSTLQLVGLLITVHLIFTGPLLITLSWIDTISSRTRGILLCSPNKVWEHIVFTLFLIIIIIIIIIIILFLRYFFVR